MQLYTFIQDDLYQIFFYLMHMIFIQTKYRKFGILKLKTSYKENVSIIT